jgi:protein CWC15
MTTANRATWKAAVGRAQESSGAVSNIRSAKNAPAHTKLKVRANENDYTQRDRIIQESLKKLHQVEDRHNKNKAFGFIQSRTIDISVEDGSRMKMITATADVDDEGIRRTYDDADEDGGKSIDEGRWSDIDDESNLDSNSDLDENEESNDDSDDEEAALQAELSKIRAERERAKERAEAAAAAEEQAKKEEAALTGNPLLNSNAAMASGKLKRRWNDDVVFRNQAKGEPTEQKRFINDTVRNDFHKRFIKTHFR